ncbi:MAG: response regulator, partial [Gammaproteobacteria bacterium]|nr:response regulator [Gammaproteobacteria bacterium]
MNHVLSSINAGVIPVAIEKYMLVISDSDKTVAEIQHVLNQDSINFLVSSGSKQALNLFVTNHIDYVIIDLDSIDMPSDELVYALRVRVSDNFIPIIVIASSINEEILSNCLSAGCDDFLIKPISHITIKTKLSALDQMHELKNLYKDSINEQLVAKQILAFALAERNVEFEEIKLLTKSKAVFSGDLFLTALILSICWATIRWDYTLILFLDL